MTKTCCFTGHRALPAENGPEYAALLDALSKAVDDAVSEGQTVNVKIIEIDDEKKKVSLSMRQADNSALFAAEEEEAPAPEAPAEEAPAEEVPAGEAPVEAPAEE